MAAVSHARNSTSGASYFTESIPPYLEEIARLSFFSQAETALVVARALRFTSPYH